MKNYLLFDPEISGHHIEYINHLLKYLSNIDNTKQSVFYHFLLHPDFDFNKIKNLALYNFKIRNLSNKDYNKIKQEKHAFIRVLNNYIVKNDIKHCFFLNINQFQIQLGKIKLNCAMSGILFNPPQKIYHFNNFTKVYESIKKHIIISRFLQTQQVHKIFILNDRRKVAYLNRLFKSSNFTFIGDPVAIDQFSNASKLNIRRKYKIQRSTKIFLIIGSLKRNKGIIESIQAIKLLPKEIKENVVLLIVGKPTTIKKSTLKNLVNGEDSIVLDTCFIPYEDFNSYIKQSDFIMMPYKNPQASSGILGHAILNEKPVIITKHGLLYDIVKDEWYGVFLNKITPKEISLGIIKSLTVSFKLTPNYKYLNEHTDFAFAKNVLECECAFPNK